MNGGEKGDASTQYALMQREEAATIQHHSRHDEKQRCERRAKDQRSP